MRTGTTLATIDINRQVDIQQGRPIIDLATEICQGIDRYFRYRQVFMHHKGCGIFGENYSFQLDISALNCSTSSSDKGRDEFAISACPFIKEVIP